MIKRFCVKNFKNFKDTLVLDLECTHDYEFNKELINNGIINKALVYGINNSGKSNLGAAIMDITTHLTDNYGYENPLYAYYSNGYFPLSPVEFEYVFLLNEKEITYRYIKSSNRQLLNEELYENGNLLFRYNYETNEYENNIPGTDTIDIGKRTNNINVLKYIYSREIYWDEDSSFKTFMNFVNNMLWFRSLKANEFMGVMGNSEDINDFIINNRLTKDFENFLKNCGQQYTLCEMINNGKRVLGVKYNNVEAVFDLVASTGTLTLRLFYYWTHRTSNISFIYLDEFDAFYHYELSEYILNYVNNQKEYQSIITSHNTFLIDNELMRPDCYLLLSKGKISSFSNLTNKVIRKAHNLEKMMLGGEFGK